MTIYEEWLNANGLKYEHHQKEAVEWCLKRENAIEHKGGIIADEMGLGKTIEILGTVYCNDLSNTLIVLPYSLMSQWEKNIIKLMNIHPLIYHGNKRNVLTSEVIKTYPIVITTYGLVGQLKKNVQQPTDICNPLREIKWNRIIYDEAHHLRNKKTCINIGAELLQTDITWFLTGTPIQNGLKDLYSLYQLMGFTNIKKNIEVLINDCMLRRTKENVGIVLPQCNSVIVPVNWKYNKEKIMAKQIHSKLTFSNLELSEEQSAVVNCDESCLKLLSDAKKVCVLPKLIKKPIKKRLILDESEEKTISTEKFEIVTNKTPSCVNEKLCKIAVTASKIEKVVNFIVQRKDNCKPKLVFCYYHGEIDEIENLLKIHKINVKKFDGRTGKKERLNILSETCEVLIGQINATNEGLNLQAYKEIYMVSPQWNPAIEDQAIARCHRIGQTDDVDIFHFIMNGFDSNNSSLEQSAIKALTLDQHICNVQDVKRKIIQKYI